MAFTVSLTFAFLIQALGPVAIVLLLILVGLLIARNFKIHGRREKAASDLELLDLKRVTDPNFAVRSCFAQSGQYLTAGHTDLGVCFDGILSQDRKKLKQLRRQTSKIQKWSNVIVANIFKALRLLQQEDMKGAGKYTDVVSVLQEISESLRDVILRCHVHTSNQHSGLLHIQKQELKKVRECTENLLADTARILHDRASFEYRDVAAHYVRLKQLLEDFDHNQIERISGGVSKTRLSILFYGISNACLKISEQTLKLLVIFEETLQLEEKIN